MGKILANVETVGTAECEQPLCHLSWPHPYMCVNSALATDHVLIIMLLDASIYWSVLGRRANAWDVLLAFISDEVWDALVDGTNEFLSIHFARQMKKYPSRYGLTNKAELKAMLCARLFIIFNRLSTIDETYEYVRFLSLTCSASPLPSCGK